MSMPELDPSHIMQVGMSFFPSKALLSAVELGLFTELAKQPMTALEIARSLGLHSRAVPDFPDALVALRFLQRTGDGSDGLYSNTAESAVFLDRNSPDYIGGILEMANARLYRFWADLTEALKTGAPQNETKHSGEPMSSRTTGKRVKDVDVSLRNINIVTMSYQDLIDVRSRYLKGACEDAVIWNLRAGASVCQPEEVLEADLVYKQDGQNGLGGNGKAEATAISGSVNVDQQTSEADEEQGDDLFLSPRSAKAIASDLPRTVRSSPVAFDARRTRAKHCADWHVR
jgi:Dimerisation domain